MLIFLDLRYITNYNIKKYKKNQVQLRFFFYEKNKII